MCRGLCGLEVEKSGLSVIKIKAAIGFKLRGCSWGFLCEEGWSSSETVVLFLCDEGSHGASNGVWIAASVANAQATSEEPGVLVVDSVGSRMRKGDLNVHLMWQFRGRD